MKYHLVLRYFHLLVNSYSSKSTLLILQEARKPLLALKAYGLIGLTSL